MIYELKCEDEKMFRQMVTDSVRTLPGSQFVESISLPPFSDARIAARFIDEILNLMAPLT